MNDVNEISKMITSAIKEAQGKGTSSYDTTAEVVRVEDGIAWVHIPGGVDETPAKMTVTAEPGDQVQVRVSDGRAWLTGNASSPPTDDKVAVAAHTRADEADGKATVAVSTAEVAQAVAEETAEEVKGLAENNKHFFYRDDSGVHITMTENQPDVGRNIKVDSNYMYVRNDTTELAMIGNDITLGQSSSKNVYIDNNYMYVRNNGTTLARFGADAQIGESTSNRIILNTNGLSYYYRNDDNEDVRSFFMGKQSMKITQAETLYAPAKTDWTSKAVTKTFTLPSGWTYPVTINTITALPPSGAVTYNASVYYTTADSGSPTNTLSMSGVGSITYSISISGNTVTFKSTDTGGTLICTQAVLTYSKTVSTAYEELKGAVPYINLKNEDTNASSSIRAYPVDGNGNNLVIHAGGNLVMGGGEYAVNFYNSVLGNSSTEHTYLGADGNVYIHTNGNTIANRKEFIFRNNGNLTIKDGDLDLWNKAIIGGDIYLTGIVRDDTGGSEFEPVNSNGNTVVGYNNYDSQLGNLHLYAGVNVRAIARNNVTIEPSTGNTAKVSTFNTSGNFIPYGDIVARTNNSLKLRGIGTNGTTYEAMNLMSASNAISIGYGTYNANLSGSALNLYGNDVRIYTRNGLSVSGGIKANRLNTSVYGDITNATQDNVSFASGTAKNFTSIKLTSGHAYILTAFANWSANATGVRKIHLDTTSNTFGNNINRTDTRVASTHSNTHQSFTMITGTLSADTTYYLVGWQNSGSTITGSGYVRALMLY